MHNVFRIVCGEIFCNKLIYRNLIYNKGMKKNIMSEDDRSFFTQNFDVSGLNYSKADRYTLGLEAMSRFENRCFYIFDYSRNEFFYLTYYRDFLFDTPKQEIKESGYDFFLRHTHPDDIAQVHKIWRQSFAWITSQPIEQQKNYKLIHFLRLREKQNQYLNARIQVNVLEHDSKGHIWLSMGINDEVAPTVNPVPYFIKGGSNEHIYFLSPNERHLDAIFSEQEQKLIKLLRQHKRTKEIATELQISSSTVNFHKQGIFTKTGTHNVFDLLQKIDNVY